MTEYADRYGIDVAIEPLRRTECNILNLVSEGTLLSALVNHPRIGALGDTFHMICSSEPYDALIYAGEKLKHIHISHTISNEKGRVWPCLGDGEDYRALFACLERARYTGRVSVEASCDDIAAQANETFQALDLARRGKNGLG